MKTIHVGCEYWCKHNRLPYPVQCIVITITDEPGKQVGVELDEKFSMTHNLDGLLTNKKGLWVLASHLMTNTEYNESLKAKKYFDSYTPKTFDSIDVDDDQPINLR